MKAEKDLKELERSYQGVDLTQANDFLTKDEDTRAILSKKIVYEELMKGEVVQSKNVSLDELGQPRHFFGFKLFHLHRLDESTKPVLNISFSGPALDHSGEEKIKVQSLTAKTGYTEEIQKALSNATNSSVAEYSEEVREISGVMSQQITPIAKALELKRSLTDMADWYFESDAHKRKEFLDKAESLFTLSYKQGVLVKNQRSGTDGVLIQEHRILLSDLPTNHKGVPINERQIKKLLGGHDIAVVAERGTEAEGMPEAKVKFNPISGRLMEIGEGQPRLSLAEQPKKNLETEVSSVRHRI